MTSNELNFLKSLLRVVGHATGIVLFLNQLALQSMVVNNRNDVERL